MIDIYLTWLAVLVLVVGVSVGVFFAMGGNEVYSPDHTKILSIAPRTNKLVEGFADRPGNSGFLEVTERDIDYVDWALTTIVDTQIYEFDSKHILVAWLDTDNSAPLNLNLSLFKRRDEYGKYELQNTDILSTVLQTAYNTVHFLTLEDGTAVLFHPNSSNVMTFSHLTIENEKVHWTAYPVTGLTYSATVAYQGLMLSQDKQHIYTYSYIADGTTKLYRLNANARGAILDTITITAPSDIKTVDINQGGMFPIAKGRNILFINDNQISYVIFDDSNGGNRTVSKVRNTDATLNFVVRPLKGVNDYEIIVGETHSSDSLPQNRLLKCKVGDSLTPSDSNILSKLVISQKDVLYYSPPTRIDNKHVLYSFYWSLSNNYMHSLMIVDIEKMAITDFRSYSDEFILFGTHILSDNTVFAPSYGHTINDGADISTGGVGYDGFYIDTYYMHPDKVSIDFRPDKGDQPVFKQNGDRIITRKALSHTMDYPDEHFNIGQAYYYDPKGKVTKYAVSANNGDYVAAKRVPFNEFAGIAISNTQLVTVPQTSNTSYNHIHRR